MLFNKDVISIYNIHLNLTPKSTDNCYIDLFRHNDLCLKVAFQTSVGTFCFCWLAMQIWLKRWVITNTPARQTDSSTTPQLSLPPLFEFGQLEHPANSNQERN